jgi:hypothetical protein
MSAPNARSWTPTMASLTLLVIVAIGYCAGLAGSEISGVATLGGAVLALICLFGWAEPKRSKAVERFGAVGLLTYLVLAVACDAILFTRSEIGLLIAVAWLTPLIIGGLVFPRRSLWLLSVAYWLVLLSGVVALAYTLTHPFGGQGFLIKIRY